MALKRKGLALPKPILLADTDPSTRGVVAAALGLDHDDIMQATDGRIALALALASPFSCVLTETSLPFIDGYSLCELLRADGATRSTPILVVTAEAGEESLGRALHAGANGVLAKPVDAETLRTEIDRVARPHKVFNARSGLPPRPHASGNASHGTSRPLYLTGPRVKSRTHDRFETTDPPLQPPMLRCPSCDRLLTYRTSHVGGVTATFAEQWDYYACPTNCNAFCYRHRTRKLRAL
jgi:two-component system chemotaxis response regulator CheY